MVPAVMTPHAGRLWLKSLSTERSVRQPYWVWMRKLYSLKCLERCPCWKRDAKALKVQELSFNSFYEFSIELLDIICMENNITEIDYDKYAYMIQPFYKGGKYEKTLNDPGGHDTVQ